MDTLCGVAPHTTGLQPACSLFASRC